MRTVPAPGPSLVPAAPPALPEQKFFRCPKAGHEQHDTEEFSFRMGNSFTGKVLHDTGPLCYQCVFDYVTDGREYDEGGPNWWGALFKFLTENFQTHRVAPPEPKEVTAEEMTAIRQAAEDAERGPAPADFVDLGGAEQRKCAEPACTTFISGTCAPEELPRFCPDHADRPAGT